MSAMFANARPAQGGGSNSGFLLEFKAGRSNLQPGSSTEKRKVVADKTKGLVFIKQSSDQLMHFCWKNRQTGAVVDDLIIFPGDTEFMKVKECPDGKVFLLKFKSSNERRLYWIQDGNPDADKDLVQKVNDLLNKPPVGRAAARGSATDARGTSANFSSSAATGGASGGIGNLGSGNEELGALGGLDQNQLMQLLSLMNHGGGSTGSGSETTPLLSNLPVSDSASVSVTAPPTTAATTTSASTTAGGAPAGTDDKVSASELAKLQSLLSGLRPGSSKASRVDLGDVLKGNTVVDVVKKNQVRFADKVIDVADSTSFTSLPNEISSTVRQPQFQQAVGTFAYAFSTGQLAPVFEQFGLPESAVRAAANGDVLELAKSLTEEEKKKQADKTAASSAKPSDGGNDDEPREPEPKRGKTEDDQDQMDLD